MIDKVRELAEVLDKIQDRKDLYYIDYDTPIMFDTTLDDPDLVRADDLACDILITAAGQPNYTAIVALNKYGYEVYAGDADSFGWLTGCICKMHSNGPVLVFG